jgi:uncharacterized membrane protein
MFHAAEFVSPGLATVIANVQPLLAAALAHAFLGERLTAFGLVGLLTGFAGIAVIAWPGLATGDVQGYTLGLAYAVLAVAGVAAANIAIKRLTGQVDAVTAMGFQLLMGAGPLALLSVLTEDVSSLVWSTEFIVVLLVLSVLGTSLAFWLWFAALEQVDLNRANAFTFLVPLFGLASSRSDLAGSIPRVPRWLCWALPWLGATPEQRPDIRHPQPREPASEETANCDCAHPQYGKGELRPLRSRCNPPGMRLRVSPARPTALGGRLWESEGLRFRSRAEELRRSCARFYPMTPSLHRSGSTATR